MKRKHFLSSIIPLAASIQGFAASADIIHEVESASNPPYLREGDLIGIACPGGFITEEEIKPAILMLQQWGFRVRVGSTVGKRDFTLGGTDEERRLDFQQMLDDNEVKAILCGRGGYGTVRIIDKLNFEVFTSYPKWIIGFSDITVIHAHLAARFNIPSLHSKMCNSFPADWNAADPAQKESINSIRKALIGEKLLYTIPPDPFNKLGEGKGKLLGGNLKTIETLVGTASDFNTKGCILFVEDAGEYLYSIDRMFWNLKRTGKLDHLKGLIIGGFKVKPDDEGDEFGKTLQEIVLEKVSEYSYPVSFGFPVGHQINNVALKCGMLHSLKISEKNVLLNEC